MIHQDDVTRAFPLLEEHLLLGAVLGEDQGYGLLGPRSYGASGERMLSEDVTYLCDLTGMSATLVTGPSSELFVSAAYAGEIPPVGQCSFGAVLSGDGSLISIVLLAHTGDREWLLWDPSPRALVLEQWLGFLSRIEQDGVAPFADVAIEDVSSSLVPLLLAGPKAREILSDYVDATCGLPEAGQVRDVRLDRIATLVAGVPKHTQEAFLVFVPPAQARVLWRSLLSFVELEPQGVDFVVERASTHWDWPAWLGEEGKLMPSAAALRSCDLVRESGGYVGQRGLR